MTDTESPDPAGHSERDQLESWFESLTEDQRKAVLAADTDDLPGWMIASLVDANLSTGDGADDLKYQIPQALREFVERRRRDEI